MTPVENMYVLVVIWAIAPFGNYAVLYNSETECERAAAVLQQGNTLSDGTYRPIVHASCLPLREAGRACWSSAGAEGEGGEVI